MDRDWTPLSNAYYAKRPANPLPGCARASCLRQRLYKRFMPLALNNSSQNQSNSAADANAMAVAAASGSSGAMVTPITLRSSITVIATLPILVVYPFLQRYFIVGMTIGGVKE